MISACFKTSDQNLASRVRPHCSIPRVSMLAYSSWDDHRTIKTQAVHAFRGIAARARFVQHRRGPKLYESIRTHRSSGNNTVELRRPELIRYLSWRKCDWRGSEGGAMPCWRSSPSTGICSKLRIMMTGRDDGLRCRFLTA